MGPLLIHVAANPGWALVSGRVCVWLVSLYHRGNERMECGKVCGAACLKHHKMGIYILKHLRTVSDSQNTV